MTDLDDFADDVEGASDDIEDRLQNDRDFARAVLDELTDERDRIEEFTGRLENQDIAQGLRMLDRYRSEGDNLSSDRQEEIEKEIDALFARAGTYKPFDDLDIERAGGNSYSIGRDTFLKGLAGLGVVGWLVTDGGNFWEGDEPGRGGLNFGTADLDLYGAFEDHRAAEGASGGNASASVEATVEREYFEDAFARLDRGAKTQVMSPGSFDRYFDSEGTEFHSLEVNYTPNDGDNTNSEINVRYVDTTEVDSMENYTSTSGWKEVDDDVAYEIIQAYDQVKDE